MALARLVKLKTININFQKEVLIILNLTDKNMIFFRCSTCIYGNLGII